MVDGVRKEHGRRGKRRAAASTMFLCGILIFAQFSLSSSALSPDPYYHQPYPSPRKVGPFHKTASFQSPRASASFTGPRPEEENRDDVYKDDKRDDVYKDDKRFVHTGPNPLHN